MGQKHFHTLVINFVSQNSLESILHLHILHKEYIQSTDYYYYYYYCYYYGVLLLRIHIKPFSPYKNWNKYYTGRLVSIDFNWGLAYEIDSPLNSTGNTAIFYRVSPFHIVFLVSITTVLLTDFLYMMRKTFNSFLCMLLF